MESRMRSVFKSVSFRLIATLTTMILVLAFTRDVVVSFEIGAIKFSGKFVLYYFHERLWDKFQLGRI